MEIGQYTFPKILEGNVQFFRKRKLIPKKIPFGANVTFALAIGFIAYAYNKDKYSVKKSMRWLIDVIFGGSDNVEGDQVSADIKAF